MQINKSFTLGLAAGVTGLLLLMLVAGLITVYSGGYNTAATEDHTPLVRWAFETTMQNSVKSRSSDVQAPERFADAMVAAGAAEYKSMCEHCHGGVGTKRKEWAQGMLPQPPHLPDVADEWEPRELFWLVKHGVKMAGMPAFGPSHKDATLWNITAFVHKLPGMTKAEYARYEASHAGSESPTHEHTH